MARFPTPGVNDTRTIEAMFGWVNNTATGGIFFPVILFSIWVIVFIGSVSEGRQASRAFMWANFSCSILAIILALLGFLQPSFMYLFIMMLAFSLIWFKLGNSRL